ncbi:myo-inositol-1(or 4)-monophosphatase [Tumebacillus sp. BK434]|uniref:inositol monophosphatase family protein n=1 Tax=Tumebacillus sp. BK434 TaxID=2512169 RepID=UPI001042D2A7|nr:inositol monophosphatase [Tumebacillus sp. BK434]TCP55698.1 myo-inositol-1(or 4)-monophosphatase [Tumebacillus sp. BK434]
MQAIVQRAKEVAAEAAVAAGKLAKERFDGAFLVEEKDEHGDLVTEVDGLAEAVILEKIRAAFPDHGIRSEETGWSGVEGDFLWLVDPLDGTNNYAIGLPVYAVAITFFYRKEAVLGVIYDSVLDKLYIAERGQGATCNGQPLRIKEPKQGNRLTVGWIQGHAVQKDPRAMRLKHHLDAVAKRVLRVWAPTLVWCLMARGELDGVVLYNSEGDDLYAGLLLLKEAGGLVIDFDGEEFAGMQEEPYIIGCHPAKQEELLQVVKAGLMK